MKASSPLHTMQRYISSDNPLSRPLTRESNSLHFVFCFTILFGFFIHGYAFFSAAYTHDSLNALYADSAEIAWKISLGRFLVPAYQLILRGQFATPWLTGTLSLIWISLSVFLLIHLFRLRTPVCFLLTSGLCVANLTYTLTAATYIHDLDANMLALLLSVFAAYRWNTRGRIHVSGILCVAAVLGLYQSYISVCMVLIIMRCMLDLLETERSTLNILCKGINGCLTLLLGAVLYIVMLKAVQHLGGYTTSSGMGNSIGGISQIRPSTIVYGALSSYRHFSIQLRSAWSAIFPEWSFTVSYVLLSASTILLVIILLIKRTVHLTRAALAMSLAFLIPPAVFFSSILSRYESLHMLMLYSLWLLYLFPLIVAYRFPSSLSPRLIPPIRLVLSLVLIVFIWGNVRTANTLYLIKDMQYDSAKSLMTRVLYRMEDHDDYVTGETPVAIIGTSPLLVQIPHSERYDSLVGIPHALLQRTPEAAYDPQYKLIAYSLGNALQLCSDDTYALLKSSETVRQMPSYPNDGCMNMINGTFVVKLGN